MDDTRLKELAGVVAERMLTRLDELVEAFWDRWFEAPEMRNWERPQPSNPQWKQARTGVRASLSALRDGFALPESCPSYVNELARVAVDYGVPIEGVVQIYRTGGATWWEAMHEEIEALELPPHERRALLRRCSRHMFDYTDRCTWWMWSRYSREHERRVRGQEQRRMQIVRDLLEGGDPELGPLGYDLDRHHLGLVARGPEAEPALHALAAQLDGRLLAVAAHHDTWWGWVGLAEPLHPAARRRLTTFRPPAGVSIAAGGPSPGADGFRAAHHEAQQAHRVSARRPAPVTLYDDVALEALAAEDEARARAFVERELGDLAEDEPRAATLRETLRAYFAVAQNSSSASALLGVHERTVANRLRAVEERLGRPVAARHAELDTALRLHELLRE